MMTMACAACASGDDSTESATSVAPAATQGADVLTPTPDADLGEFSTTLATDARQVEDSVDTVPEPIGVQPEGFTTTTVRITKPDGDVCELCMWLADDSAERGRGLMGVTDLGDAAGMIFAFEQLRSGSFFMFQTVTPLSIAWFDDDGAFVSATDMDPCVSEDSALCERFPAGGPFMSAIEVFQGDLAAVGIEPGSTAVIVAGSEAATCPASL